MKKRIYFIWVLLLPLIMQAQTSSTADEVKRHLTRAKTAFSVGEYEDALVEYQKAQKLIPDFPDLYKAIGEIYEKLGDDNDLKAAIESYNQYLKLAPDAADKNAVIEKITALEYLHEKQAKQTEILNDFSGVWISDIKSDDKKAKDKPAMIFRITEVGRTGKFRIEILEECGFYTESIIQKTVNIAPDKKNNITFTFADAKVYTPSSGTYAGLRMGARMLGLGDIADMAVNAAIDIAQENDLPTNTKTAYRFELQYVNGELKGYCYIIKNHADPRKVQETQNDVFEIILRKDDQYYKELHSGLTFSSFSGITRDYSGKALTKNDVKKKLQETPDLYKQWQRGYRMSNTGGAMVGVGLGCLIDGLLFSATDDGTSTVDWKRVSSAFYYAGVGFTFIGVPLIVSGTNQQKSAIREHSNRMDNKTESVSLNFGITPSGGVGLVLNF